MIYTIKNDKTEVKINSLGAEVRSVVHNGKERAWQNETGEWAGCAILLFPFAGFNRLVYDGVDFGIQKHGFCRNEEFSLVSQTKNTTLVLSFAQSSNSMLFSACETRLNSSFLQNPCFCTPKSTPS